MTGRDARIVSTRASLQSHDNAHEQAEEATAHDAADETSSSGTSSEDDNEDDNNSSSEDDDDPDDGTTLDPSDTRITRRTNIDTNLKSRLVSFLPQIHKANKDLEDAGDILAHQIDDVADDEEEYVEMNLGLGVLSAKEPGENVHVEGSDSEDENDGEKGDGSVMARLRGQKDRSATAGKGKVEEL